jgi:hypothetical protein
MTSLARPDAASLGVMAVSDRQNAIRDRLQLRRPGSLAPLAIPGGDFPPNLFWHGQRLSKLLCHAGGMKITKRNYKLPLNALLFQPTTIARFGPARLVKNFAGAYELIGGTPADHAAAREWCSLFAPAVVFASAPRIDFAIAVAA